MVVVGGGDGGGEGEQTERNNEKGEREGGGDVERHKNNWKGTRREGERDKTRRGKGQDGKGEGADLWPLAVGPPGKSRPTFRGTSKLQRTGKSLCHPPKVQRSTG